MTRKTSINVDDDVYTLYKEYDKVFGADFTKVVNKALRKFLKEKLNRK
jgi:2-oxoglutarate dehydrogenase complex dehydrogenase (E1) component-like enzyme